MYRIRRNSTADVTVICGHFSDWLAVVNFSFLRYLAVFSGTFIAVCALIFLELLLLFALIEFGPGVKFGIAYDLLRMSAPGILIFLGGYELTVSIFFLAAFAVAALIEGQRYLRRNPVPPLNINMLTGSVAMALIGMAVVFILMLFGFSQLVEGASFRDFRLNSGFVFNWGAGVVAASVASRISFGFGLRSELKRQPDLADKQP